MKDTKQLIIESAQELFAENGFDATSTREIAQKAGVNIAMLSYYFNSKLNLLKEIIDTKMVQSWDISKLDFEQIDHWAILDQFIDIHVEKIFNNSSFHCMMFRETTFHNREDVNELWFSYLKKHHESFLKLLRNGYKKGVFKKVDEELTMLTIISTISRIVMSQWVLNRLVSSDNKEQSLNDSLKKRIKKHLTDLMHAHLKPEKK
jgi:AcrR family transcriptional regulator